MWFCSIYLHYNSSVVYCVSLLADSIHYKANNRDLYFSNL